MITVMKDLPEGIDGVEAEGTVTRKDYEKVLKPLVERAASENRRIRFIYRLGADFEKFTPGAAWEDFSLGLRHLSTFERCVVLTDKEWIRNACRLMAPLVPCPFRVFGDDEKPQALQWLQAEPNSSLNIKFIPGAQVLIVDATAKLTRWDFEALSAQVDPRIRAHEGPRGIVVHAKRFPGWKNLGSFFRHIEFVTGYHRKVQRVALSVDGILPEMVPKVMNYALKAELKHFSYDELESAIQWAENRDANPSAA